MKATRPPLNLLFWLTISISFTLFLVINNMSFYGALIYGFFILILYFCTNTTDCRIQIRDDKLFIKYLNLFKRKVILDLKNVDNISFEKGEGLHKLLFAGKIEAFIRSKDKLNISYKNNELDVILISTNRADLQELIKSYNV